jgi:cell division protein ZapA
MKQLEVQIMGQSYLLGCPENGDARMLDAVNRVDMAMCRIRDAGKIKARDRIAVLAALNLAFELPERTPNGAPAPAAAPARKQCRSRAPAARSPAAAAGHGPGHRRPPALKPGRLPAALARHSCLPTREAAKAYNEDVCDAYWALYFLEPMLFEHGLGKLSGRCDRLASDEPET